MAEALDLTHEFAERDPQWRISAVIHDGQWYDAKKWGRIASVGPEVLEKWIEENSNILITKMGDNETLSYRVEHDEVIRWYEENEIDLTTMLIPRNFPPKVWGGYTEAEAFLAAPRRRVGTISFNSKNEVLLAKVKKILRGVAIIMPDKQGRHKAFGLSAMHIRKMLNMKLTEAEAKELDMKSRSVIMQREINDFPESWLEKSLIFYITYAKTILKSSMSTIKIYIPEPEDREAQIVLWVMAAMKKFDETQPIPFSGYLATVLRHWPYDLPDEYLGKELSRYQREVSRLREDLADKGVDMATLPDTEIAKMLNLSRKEYVSLAKEHQTWMNARNAATLTWEESGNEKAGVAVGAAVGKPVTHDIELANKLSHASILAALESEEWDSAWALIDKIDKSDGFEEVSDSLTREFLRSFAFAVEILGGFD